MSGYGEDFGGDERQTREPPNSVPAEQAVLGGLMLDNEAWHKLADRLGEKDFYRADHRLIFQAIRFLADSGQPFDVVSMAEALEKFGWMEDSGGLVYLGEMARNTPSAVNIVTYAAIVRERAQMRELIAAGHDIAESAYYPQGITMGAVLAEAEAKIARIADGGADDAADVSLVDALDGFLDRLQAAADAKQHGRTVGTPTGIKSLDGACGGLHGGELTILGARPGMGKTSAALCFARNAALQGYRVGFVSTEMGATELAGRLTSLDAEIPAVAMRDGTLEREAYARLTSSMLRLRDLPLRILDKPSCKLANVNAIARAWMLDGGLDLLIVDYLQRLIPDGRPENRTREVGIFAAGMKTIARTHRIPVLALSQLNRGVANRTDKRPNMADLRDSGEIEQEADAVWMIHRPQVYDPTQPAYDAEIIIGKNRHGPCEIVRVGWEGQYMRFEEHSENNNGGYENDY